VQRTLKISGGKAAWYQEYSFCCHPLHLDVSQGYATHLLSHILEVSFEWIRIVRFWPGASWLVICSINHAGNNPFTRRMALNSRVADRQWSIANLSPKVHRLMFAIDTISHLE
jgi:hypothetical protein